MRLLLLCLVATALLAGAGLSTAWASEPEPDPAVQGAPSGSEAGEVSEAGEAADEAAAPASDVPPTLGQVLVGVILGLFLVAGVGSLLGLFRVMFPGPTRAADAAVLRLGTGRLLLTGVLPIVGAGLLGVAAEATGSEAVQIVWGIVFGLPAMILIAVGGLAVVPHLGGRLIARSPGQERSVLAKCVAGALVLVLAIGTLGWAAKPIAPIIGVLVAAWFLGTGLGTIFRPRSLPENGLESNLEG